MIKICGKWEMQTPTSEHNEWFADWAIRRPNEVSRHLTMGYHALQELRDIPAASVHESFGGMGAQAMMAEEMWPDALHTVRDFSPAAVQYLTENLPLREGLEILSGSSYDPAEFIEADIQILDCGDGTAHTMVKNPELKGLLDHTFVSKPKAVVWTDIAGRLLHLHLKTYRKVIGPFTNYEEYLFGVGELVARTYGYFPTVTYRERWSSITVFLPEPDLIGHRIVDCPETPVGLKFS